MRLMALLGLLVFESCLKVDTINTDNWQPEIAFPLIYSNIKITDFLNNTDASDYYEVDSTTNFLTLVYQDQILSPPTEDFISIDDFGMIIPDSVVGIPPDYFPFDQTIRKFRVKSGTLSYTITSSIPGIIDLNVQFFNITHDGHNLAQYNTIENNGTDPRVITGTIDLAGYEIDFSQHFVVMYRATDNDGNRYLMDAVNYTFENMEFSYLEGDFGGVEFEVPQSSFLIDILDRSVGGDFYLDDPKIHFDIDNYIGFPIILSALELQAANQDGTLIPFTSPLDNGIALNFPSMSEIGMSSRTRFTLDKTNSNILEVVNAFPKQLDYRLKGTTQSTLPDSLSFAIDTSKMKVTLGVELPLYGRVKNLIYESVGDLDPTDLMEGENIEFKLYTENGYPLEVGFQVYFEDAQGMVVDSLADANNPIFVASGEVNSDGVVVNSTTSDISVMMARDKIEKLENVTQFRVQARLTTVNNGTTSVRFLDTYELKLNIGAKVLIQ